MVEYGRDALDSQTSQIGITLLRVKKLLPARSIYILKK